MMTETAEKLEAEPVNTIICRESGEVVGYLYRWNDGTIEPYWLAGRRDGVTYGALNILK